MSDSVRDNGPQRDNAQINLCHYTLDFEGAVGGSLGSCPRDGTYWGLEMRVLVLAPNNLASIIYEWVGQLLLGPDVGVGASTRVGPAYRKGSLMGSPLCFGTQCFRDLYQRPFRAALSCMAGNVLCDVPYEHPVYGLFFGFFRVFFAGYDMHLWCAVWGTLARQPPTPKPRALFD